MRPAIAFYADRCRESFCCEQVCTENAIEREGFRINPARCTVCGDCVQGCVYGALKLIGETLTPQQLMNRVRVDEPYFSRGGGVTLSGGEPTLHLEFVDRFLDLCAQRGINTGIETAGLFSREKCLPVLEKFDFIYFDLKILDRVRHEKAVGKGLETILSNATHLATNGFPVEFRMPLVPGYTDTQENIDAVISFLKSVNDKRLHLLEYHNMGEVKIDVIQGKQPKLGLGRYTDEGLNAILGKFEEAEIEVVNRGRARA